ncbi:MAG: hypothetical protein IPJ03_16630 [Ignavibacteriales bacterium]|nr:hypothetical protein [Ignavibacteriales bacterium]
MTAPINLAELKELAEKNIHIRFYTEHEEFKEDVAYFTGANPTTLLTLIIAIEVLREALKEYSILEVDGSVDYNIAADALAKIKEILE